MQQRGLSGLVLVAVLSAEYWITRRQVLDEVVDDRVVGQQGRHGHLHRSTTRRLERHDLLRFGSVGQRLHEVGVSSACCDEDVADAVVHILEQFILGNRTAHLVPLALDDIKTFACQRSALQSSAQAVGRASAA